MWFKHFKQRYRDNSFQQKKWHAKAKQLYDKHKQGLWDSEQLDLNFEEFVKDFMSSSQQKDDTQTSFKFSKKIQFLDELIQEQKHDVDMASNLMS